MMPPEALDVWLKSQLDKGAETTTAAATPMTTGAQHDRAVACSQLLLQRLHAQKQQRKRRLLTVGLGSLVLTVGLASVLVWQPEAELSAVQAGAGLLLLALMCLLFLTEP